MATIENLSILGINTNHKTYTNKGLEKQTVTNLPHHPLDRHLYRLVHHFSKKTTQVVKKKKIN